MFALTHQANIAVFTPFSLAAFISFQAKTSIIAFSISKLNSLLSSIVKTQFFFILLSISFFILVFKPEKLKLNSFFTNQTRGNKEEKEEVLYSLANFEIIGHHGYSNHIIFAALSNASQAASSIELPNFSKVHIFFIK
ncbi:MAG: hypothetical protein LBD88_03125 [Candidatus Peribacteria bacterium]|nr:hypothetical protein [Candidatus Peribacteria bacterium]